MIWAGVDAKRRSAVGFQAGKREGRNLGKDLEPCQVTRVGLISNYLHLEPCC
jgi:hypothetical protein